MVEDMKFLHEIFMFSKWRWKQGDKLRVSYVVIIGFWNWEGKKGEIIILEELNVN